MDVSSMHILFRTLGQQMGFQQIRAILPESIDKFLNLSVKTLMDSILKSNAQSVSQDVRTPQYGKISPINGLHTLYRTEEISISGLTNDNNNFSVVLANGSPFIYTNFGVKYDGDEEYFDARLIEPERVYMTNKDYLNRASKEYPIISINNGHTIASGAAIQNNVDMILFTGGYNDKVDKVKVQYIKMPATITYSTTEANCVNCDLPEHLHEDVVQLAVELWMKTLGLTSQQARNENNN